MKKMIAICLILCILTCMLSGCDKLMELVQKQSEILKQNQTTKKLSYELTQEMVDDFYNLLEQTEDFCINTQDADAADQQIERLDDAYMELIDQNQIAYINYCIDQTDETQKKLYMDCVDITTEAQTAYIDMCKRIYLSAIDIRDELFADWTEEEIDRMLNHNQEVADLEKRNAEITVEYRDLEEDETWEENMVVLYNELVQNNNRIAEIYGYENYYEYAYQVVYKRDYEMEEILRMRQYVARYLPETYDAVSESFDLTFDELNTQDQGIVIELLFSPYDELEENYVMAYLNAAPETLRTAMMEMFEEERVIFTDSPNAYQGAFTTCIDERPFCFYGPGYTGSLTLIHELGHYYGTSFTDLWSQPMDLAETQSQGNEWLFTRFLEQQISSEAYHTMVEYKLLSDLGNVICFLMIDEFEQQVYSSDRAGDLTLEEYEAIMEDIAESYGGIDYITENIMDVQLYWKYVVLESPVYYISYAVSGVAAMNLFTISEEDYEKAFEIYVKLIEQPQEDAGFLENIRYAGLTGPFEETVYQQLSERYGN